MFLDLKHTKLEVYKVARSFSIACYRLSRDFPSEEKYNLAQQLRRAAHSVILNLAEGCSRKSLQERRRFFEIARGSVIEIDTILDICVELGFVVVEKLEEIKKLLISTFKLLCGMIEQQGTHH